MKSDLQPLKLQKELQEEPDQIYGTEKAGINSQL